MYTVLLVIHIMVTLALVCIILMQRPAGDGMGLSGSSSTSFMSGRSAANFITHTTSVLAVIFILSSLTLGWITAHNRSGGSLMDKLGSAQSSVLSEPLTPKPAAGSAKTDTAKPAAIAPAKETPKPAVPRPE